MDKINYYLLGEQEISKIKKLKKKPTLLLHACCAPCASWPITYLCSIFDITIFFNNSNIYPKEEHTKRENELKGFIEKFNKDNKTNIKVIYIPYEYEKYIFISLWTYF